MIDLQQKSIMTYGREY